MLDAVPNKGIDTNDFIGGVPNAWNNTNDLIRGVPNVGIDTNQPLLRLQRVVLLLVLTSSTSSCVLDLAET